MTPTSFPQLLVAREKHDTRYWHVASLEDLDRISVEIVRERLDPDYCYYWDEDPPKPLTEEEQELLSVTDNQIDAMPSSVRQTVLAARSRALRQQRVIEAFDPGDGDATRAKRIVAAFDAHGTTLFERVSARLGPLRESAAWLFLDERSDHEYELVKLRRYQNGDEL